MNRSMREASRPPAPASGACGSAQDELKRFCDLRRSGVPNGDERKAAIRTPSHWLTGANSPFGPNFESCYAQIHMCGDRDRSGTADDICWRDLGPRAIMRRSQHFNIECHEPRSRSSGFHPRFHDGGTEPNMEPIPSEDGIPRGLMPEENSMSLLSIERSIAACRNRSHGSRNGNVSPADIIHTVDTHRQPTKLSWTKAGSIAAATDPSKLDRGSDRRAVGQSYSLTLRAVQGESRREEFASRTVTHVEEDGNVSLLSEAVGMKLNSQV
ncbi:hypothetical protein OBBRIDRAFT_805750 [Obba rivulosa]|uniref:Uncharacterized protein n=1 Tax=Obba rivulosa TaxID=1052685 RepID=A0A8E2AT40_9APHY|nr:hypothetical protein OBBRIDRAFT_805750 [Obba rivulosa]